MPTRHPQEEIHIRSRDYWFKLLDNHQTNWCLVDDNVDGTSTAYFLHELSGVFDQIEFATNEQAIAELEINGFCRLADAPELAVAGGPPPPFHADRHPTGPIYSSGRFWRK